MVVVVVVVEEGGGGGAAAAEKTTAQPTRPAHRPASQPGSQPASQPTNQPTNQPPAGGVCSSGPIARLTAGRKGRGSVSIRRGPPEASAESTARGFRETSCLSGADPPRCCEAAILARLSRAGGRGARRGTVVRRLRQTGRLGLAVGHGRPWGGRVVGRLGAWGPPIGAPPRRGGAADAGGTPPLPARRLRCLAIWTDPRAGGTVHLQGGGPPKAGRVCASTGEKGNCPFRLWARARACEVSHDHQSARPRRRTRKEGLLLGSQPRLEVPRLGLRGPRVPRGVSPELTVT